MQHELGEKTVTHDLLFQTSAVITTQIHVACIYCFHSPFSCMGGMSNAFNTYYLKHTGIFCGSNKTLTSVVLCLKRKHTKNPTHAICETG